VLPLLVIQQYALITLREESLSEADRAIFEKMVVRSLYGNINASRNSA
jgi:phosphoenolpyruvate carboxylase